ncbi:MAG: GNAT family N-acetyltransferase [Alphaproteobacteria bacterium]|nr:GNAT family N-acetyltransferase [Alphaproteobacteria bacterium]
MELTTRRLLLRPLREDDAPALARGLNNFNVSRNLARVPWPYSLEDASAFIALQRGFDPRGCVCAIAFNCAPDELIGMISYEPREDGRFELGYWLHESCWGLRIMSEAAAALVHYAFTMGGVSVLASGYHADNPKSGRILRRLGFVETHEEMNLSLAQGKDVATIKLRLGLADWLSQNESRAA